VVSGSTRAGCELRAAAGLLLQLRIAGSTMGTRDELPISSITWISPVSAPDRRGTAFADVEPGSGHRSGETQKMSHEVAAPGDLGPDPHRKPDGSWSLSRFAGHGQRKDLHIRLQ